MDASFLQKLIPEVDPAFLKAWSAFAVPTSIEGTLRTYALVLYDFFLRKRDAFSRGAREELAGVLEEEKRVIDQV
ncbi:hypothetical protein EPN90_02905 [Patescibacteria group bacterium]|nr:MAG: hypothetical protein EPN90_02905 [Patescibacteria group bacterium]